MSSQNMEASKINKYSVKESSVPGTFFQNIPVYDIPEKFDSFVEKTDSMILKRYKEYRIDKLSEKEKMEGWIRVLPKFVVREEEVFINNEKVKVRRKIRNLTHLSLNLSQLPDYLWKRMKTKYIDKRFVGYTVKDKIYKYKVYATEVDEQIRTLRKLIKSHNINGKNKGKIKQLLKEINNKVDKNFEKGWIILKAESI
jgi:hypothetical protein